MLTRRLDTHKTFFHDDSAMVPALRIRVRNTAPLQAEGDFVLYWMIANRRTRWNFALQRALEHSAELGKPLLVFEALRVDYRWACDRFHQFVLDGMQDNAAQLAADGVTYYPYLEPNVHAGQGLLAALAGHAAVVVTDDFPSFFLPRMVDAAAAMLPVRLEAVDSNGLLPLAAVDQVFPTAYAFRRALQRVLPQHFTEQPLAEPWPGSRARRARWCRRTS